MPHVVLNMIVKDEARIVAKGLATVKPHIDAWVIVDTGSTDGTQQVIRDALEGVPGTLHERPWTNFAVNRSEALDLARAEHPNSYALILDADDLIEFPSGFSWPDLVHDAYYLTVQHFSLTFKRLQLLRLARGWKYVGAVHEVAVPPDGLPPNPGGPIEGLLYRRTGEVSARSSDPAKYAKDAVLLQQEFAKNPAEGRTLFYLAQSLKDADFPAEALRRYEERVKMGGWAEEVFMSMLEAARLRERLGEPGKKVTAAYLRAWEYRPTRAEPLYELARYCRLNQHYASAYRYARRAYRIPQPPDVLFVRSDIYEWRIADEYALAAHFVGLQEEAVRLVDEAIAKQPGDGRLHANRRFMVEALDASTANRPRS
jgi:glycosyltransferase involved in cell wall biosynthesis